MEGCQHNTMDVEYYGPNPQMGALVPGRAARGRGDGAPPRRGGLRRECRRLFERGSRWIDAHLFNGEYYEHQVPAAEEQGRHRARPAWSAWARPTWRSPDYQLGAGCLVDQLVGQYHGPRLRPGPARRPRPRPRRTLRSILQVQPPPEASTTHFNHMRTFALGDESRAASMADYPREPAEAALPLLHRGDDRLRVHGRGRTCSTRGWTQRACACIRAIRDRYDGARRNPFDEAECGHHYARAMASWATAARAHRLPLVGGHGHARARGQGPAASSGRTARPGAATRSPPAASGP